MAFPTHGNEFHERQSWKQPVRAATTANITIATALNNADTLDGVTLATGDRVLVKDQTTGSQNGIYVVGASPARATDFNSQAEILGAVIVVMRGSTNEDTAWICTNDPTITVDTTALVFATFGGGGGGGGTPTLEDVLLAGNDTGGTALISDDPSYVTPTTLDLAPVVLRGATLGPGDDGVDVSILAGFGNHNGSNGAQGGEIDFYAGKAGGTGGNVEIYGGNAQVSTDGDGGDVYLWPGNGDGTGRRGLTILGNLPTADPGVSLAMYSDLGELTVSGPVGHAMRGLAAIVAQAAIANTETVVTTYSMPANTMVAGTTFRIKAYGRITSGGTPGNSIFRCRIGTTTLTGNIAATLTMTNATSVTNAPFVLDILVTVRTAGAGGTAIGNVSVLGGVTAAFTSAGDVSAISATVAVDTTAIKRVELTYISGNAGTTGRFENATLEVL